MPKSTREVALELATTNNNLLSAIGRRKIHPAPAKNGEGSYCWTDEDVDRARRALAIDLRRQRRQRVAELAIA